MLAELHLVWLRGDGLYSIYREFPSKLWGRISYVCPPLWLRWSWRAILCHQEMLLAAEKVFEQASQFKVRQCLHTQAISVSVYLPIIVRPSFPTLGWSQVSGRPVPLSLRGSRITPLVSLAQWGPVLPARTTSPCSHTPLPTQDLP